MNPSTALLAVLAAAAQLPAAHAFAQENAAGCRIDLVAGRIVALPGITDARVTLERGHRTWSQAIPACFEYEDRVSTAPGTAVRIETVTERFEMPRDHAPGWSVPLPKDPQRREAKDILVGLYVRFTGAGRSVTLSGAGRSGTACPPSAGTPPPLAIPARLARPDQRIGADLRQLVAAWKPAEQPRLVRARLLREDGTTLAAATACAAPHVVLPIRAGAIAPGQHLTLILADEQGGDMRYDIAVIPADSLPRPAGDVAEDWLVAAWRIAEGPVDTALDSLTRISRASDTRFGAQLAIGAIIADTPL